jgi:TPR repeat protein
VAYWDATKSNELAACETSAETGNAEAEFGYGLILFSGHDRSNDRASGLDWLRKSARQGHPLARGMLCEVVYREQVGKTLLNPVEGYAWCSVSGSEKRASEIKIRLTALEAEDAERLAAEYLTKYGRNKPLPWGT